MQAKFVDVDGIKTRYVHAGRESAYPIMFIHGFSATAELWLPNIDALSDEFYVVAPDMVGQGFTHPVDFDGGPPHPKTVKHLCRFADLLGLDKFCPAGSSYGALISALLYFEMPDRVNNLILNGSGSCFNTEEQLKVALKRAYDFSSPAITNPTLDACRTMMAFTVHDPASLPEALLWMLLNSYAQPWMADAWEAAILGMMKIEESRPYRILDRLEALDLDVLMLQGREDPSGLYESAVAAAKRMPRARMETFEKCGHLPNLEHAEAYNHLVRRFLKSATLATQTRG